MRAMKRLKKILPILLKVLTGLFSVVLIAIVGMLLVLAQPGHQETKKEEPQPLLAASPSLNIEEETDLPSLIEPFPVPVLSFMSGSGMVFVSGSSYDVSLEGGFGRILALYWQTADGEPLILQSIYPASALSLLNNGYHFSPIAGPTLFGTNSVRMEDEETVRVHAATDTGLYVVIVPKSAGSRLSSLSRSLQLFSVRAADR